MKTNTTLRLGALIAALTVSACTPPGASPSPSGSASPTVSAAPVVTASPTASPSEAPAPAPAPEEPDYDFTRLYSLHVGGHFWDYEGRPEVTVTQVLACPWVADVTITGQDPNISMSWNSEAFDPAGPTYTFSIFGDVNTVSTFDSPVNPDGIGIGASMSAVLAQYPDAVVHTDPESAYGAVTQARVDDPASDARYYFWAYAPAGRVFKIDFGTFPTEGYWPNGWDCVD